MPRLTAVETPTNAPPRPSPMSGAGTTLFAGLVDNVEPNTDVENELWYGDATTTGIAHKMERDAHVSRALQSVVDPILAAQWDFEPATREEIDLEVADFCRFVFFECNSWRQTLRRASRYLRDGSAVLEVTDDVKPVPEARFPLHPGRGRGILITGFHDIPRRTVYRWKQSDADPRRIAGIIQMLGGSDVEGFGFIDISADRLLRFSWQQEGANFDGVAPMRACYGPWKVKIMLTLVDAIRHEREGAGLPVMKLPENVTDEDVQEADDILSGIRSSHKGRLVLPAGYDFSFQTPNGSPTQLEEAIKRCNFDIAHQFALGWMLLGTGGNGSYALATEQRGQYALALESHAKFLEEIFNQGSDGFSPVERLVRLNYGQDVALPRLVARNLPTKDWTRVFPVVSSLIGSKAITPDDTLEQMMRDVLTLPSRDEETAREGAEPEPMVMEAPVSEPMEDDQEEESDEEIEQEVTDEEEE